MTESDNTSLIVGAAVIVLPLLVLFNAIANLVLYIPYALALAQLWVWYIVPIFGLPPLSIGGSYGISLIVGLVTSCLPPKTDEKLSELWFRSIIAAIVIPVTALIAGWLMRGYV